jgi:hypothetical protein
MSFEFRFWIRIVRRHYNQIPFALSIVEGLRTGEWRLL